VEEFGASGLAWRRIVEGIIVEKLWKDLGNFAPDLPLDPPEGLTITDIRCIFLE
jgi:hypothetical protein